MKKLSNSRGFSVVEMLVLIVALVLLLGVGLFIDHFRAQKSNLLKQLNTISAQGCQRTMLQYENGNLDSLGTWTAKYSCSTPYGQILQSIQSELVQIGYSSTVNNYPKQGSLEYRKGAVYLDFIFGPQTDSQGIDQTFTNSTHVNSLEIDIAQSPK